MKVLLAPGAKLGLDQVSSGPRTRAPSASMTASSCGSFSAVTSVVAVAGPMVGDSDRLGHDRPVGRLRRHAQLHPQVSPVHDHVLSQHRRRGAGIGRVTGVDGGDGVAAGSRVSDLAGGLPAAVQAPGRAAGDRRAAVIEGHAAAASRADRGRVGDHLPLDRRVRRRGDRRGGGGERGRAPGRSQARCSVRRLAVHGEVNVPSTVGLPLLSSGVSVSERFPTVSSAVPALGYVTDGNVPVACSVNAPEAGTGVPGTV